MKESLKSFFLGLSILIIIMMVGAMMNLTAVANNGGRMPVEVDFRIDSSSHFSFQNRSEINNYHLTDIIDTTIPEIGWISIGDILLVGGYFFIIIYGFYWVFALWQEYKIEKRFENGYLL